METFHFDHSFPGANIAYAALYTNVSNPDKIKKRIIDAAKAEGSEGERERDAVNFSFIDASLITSRLHLETAIHQAIIAYSQNSLRTKTIHSEILFVLSPTNNITEAIRRYGVSDSSKSLLVVHITDSSHLASEVESKMNAVVEGSVVAFNELEHITDWARVKKYYKLEKETREWSETSQQYAFIDNVVISSVAMKSVMQ